MGTKKVLLEPSVNEAIWGKGIKNVPHRLRVRLHRKRNDNEDAPADEKLYTQVSVVPTTDFKVRRPPLSLPLSLSHRSLTLFLHARRASTPPSSTPRSKLARLEQVGSHPSASGRARSRAGSRRVFSSSSSCCTSAERGLDCLRSLECMRFLSPTLVLRGERESELVEERSERASTRACVSGGSLSCCATMSLMCVSCELVRALEARQESCGGRGARARASPSGPSQLSRALLRSSPGGALSHARQRLVDSLNAFRSLSLLSGRPPTHLELVPLALALSSRSRSLPPPAHPRENREPDDARATSSRDDC